MEDELGEGELAPASAPLNDDDFGESLFDDEDFAEEVRVYL